MILSKAWKWDQISDEQWNRPAEMMYYLAHRWQEEGRERILDLGCGIGRHAVFFAEQGFEVEAMDLSPEGIARVEAVAKERSLSIRTTLGDMVSLPFDTGSFDGVIAFHSIYHTDRNGIEKVISEIQRILKPGGGLFITFNSKSNPTFTDPDNQIVDEHTIVKTKGIEAGVPHYYVDEPEIRRLLTGFSFIRFQHIQEFFAMKHTWHYFIHAIKS